MFSLILKDDQMEKAKKEKIGKILVLSGGSLGREKKSYVRGQVLVRETTIEKAGQIDLFNGLYPGEEETLTPFRDIALDPVPNPYLYIRILETTSGKEVYHAYCEGDRNGFFKHETGTTLKPGNYEVQLLVKAEINKFHFTETIVLEGERFILSGKSKLKILPENYDSVITTSDIDQTWLATPLESVKGKIFTLFETPAEKKQIAGMAELYSNLRSCTSGSPLSFISASPHFYRRTFFAKFGLEKIESESLHLKYLKGTIQELGQKFRETFSSPSVLFSEDRNEKLSELKKSARKYYQSLFDQVAYKLSILLHNRIYQPTGAREILLGDDTESDFLIYSIYQLILSGVIKGEELENFLCGLEFNGKSAITKSYASTIRKYADECLALHGSKNSVQSVLINHTDSDNSQKKLFSKVQQVLPIGIRISMIKDFKLFVLTEGSLGFAAILHSQGILGAHAVLNIARSVAEEEKPDLTKILELITNLDFLDVGKKTRLVMEKTLRHAFQL